MVKNFAEDDARNWQKIPSLIICLNKNSNLLLFLHHEYVGFFFRNFTLPKLFKKHFIRIGSKKKKVPLNWANILKSIHTFQHQNSKNIVLTKFFASIYQIQTEKTLTWIVEDESQCCARDDR